jgi:hypothetical protein
LTNLDTRKSIVPATGSLTRGVNLMERQHLHVTGHGIFPGHPVTEEPGIWYLSGRIFATLDADDNPTSINVTGKLVDLCGRLGH